MLVHVLFSPLSVNVLVTLATELHLECHCKALFETPFIYLEYFNAIRNVISERCELNSELLVSDE
jgi:hypothetical protein